MHGGGRGLVQGAFFKLAKAAKSSVLLTAKAKEVANFNSHLSAFIHNLPTQFCRHNR